jgi:hypothetical protein
MTGLEIVAAYLRDGCMAIYLDGDLVETQAGVLAEALEAMRLHLLPSQRVISEVRINGHLLYGEELIELRGAELQDVKLEVSSASPVQLVVETLLAVREGLPRTYEAQQQAILQIHQGQIDAGLAVVKETVEFWDHVLGALALSVDMLKIDPRSETFLSRDLTLWADELRRSLGDLQDAMEKKDTRKVQTLLAGHWPDLTESWGRLLDYLAGELRSKK